MSDALSPRTSELHQGNYITKDNVGRGLLVTIKAVVKRNVALEDEEAEFKWALTFHETDKPLILNITNITTCEELLGNETTDTWIGKRIVLYVEPSVMYAGKKVGGIRIRLPRPGAAAPPPPPPPVNVVETELDEPPF